MKRGYHRTERESRKWKWLAWGRDLAELGTRSGTGHLHLLFSASAA